jgi:hypothetical protein
MRWHRLLPRFGHRWPRSQMNNGIEASREVPRFACPEIFLNEFYAPMCRKVIDSTTAKIIHDYDLAAKAGDQIDKM